MRPAGKLQRCNEKYGMRRQERQGGGARVAKENAAPPLTFFTSLCESSYNVAKTVPDACPPPSPLPAGLSFTSKQT
jgi:hypothetical protein